MGKGRPKVAILGTRFGDFDVERQILGDVELSSGHARNRAEILAVATGADVILAGAAPVFDAGTLEALRARAIVRLGVGTDTVDLDAARQLGMWVANVPDYGTEAVALHTVTLVLACLRRLTQADRQMKSGSWGVADLRPLHLPPSLTVGLIGFGRIGRRVARMLKGVGFDRFLVADPLPAALNGDLADLNIEFVKLSDVLSTADVVSLHAPPEARGHLLGSQELNLMKEGSVLVNTARGALVDTVALISGLAQGRPAMAALDVFEHEPPDVTMFEGIGDRVILTPHMSWYTEESELALRRQGAAEALRILQSQPPLHAVVIPAGRGVS
ncbi:MAG TPA: C-terminal binding protein [Acidimicrobiia bacterium]|nr:C-terminal binding protein [Acidimicrobiia bacterium]